MGVEEPQNLLLLSLSLSLTQGRVGRMHGRGVVYEGRRGLY
jgi:hypothetical protein